MFVTPSAEIEDDLMASPSAFPTLTSKPADKKQGIRNQLRVMEAERQMYSDLADCDLARFADHP
jgi:hypothetical protein